MFLTLLPYLTVAANLALVLGVLLGLNQRVRQLRTQTGKQEKALQTETARLSAEIAELQGRILELEQTGNSIASSAAATGSATATGNSVNNTLRSKVLKSGPAGEGSQNRHAPL